MANVCNYDIGEGAQIQLHKGVFADFPAEKLQAVAERVRTEEYRHFKMGKFNCKFPRKQLVFKNEYKFSRQLFTPCQEQFDLIEACAQHFCATYGGDVENLVVLVNGYFTKDDYISDHSDDEPGLAAGKPVGTYIFGGAAGRFVFTSKAQNPTTKMEFEPSHGDAIFMTGEQFQRNWLHGVPKFKGGKKGWEKMAAENPEFPWRLSVTIRINGNGDAPQKRGRRNRGPGEAEVAKREAKREAKRAREEEEGGAAAAKRAK